MIRFDFSKLKVKNFRNRIVHDYTGLDRFITFEIIREQLPYLKKELTAIIPAEVQKGTFSREEWKIAQTSPYLRHVDFKDLNNTINK